MFFWSLALLNINIYTLDFQIINAHIYKNQHQVYSTTATNSKSQENLNTDAMFQWQLKFAAVAAGSSKRMIHTKTWSIWLVVGCLLCKCLNNHRWRNIFLQCIVKTFLAHNHMLGLHHKNLAWFKQFLRISDSFLTIKFQSSWSTSHVWPWI